MSKTNYERIKSMTCEDLAIFLAKFNDLILVADRYICNRCKEENNGRCPFSDDDKCRYSNDAVTTVMMWLEGEVADNEQRAD